MIIRRDKKCSPAQMCIARSSGHRFKIERRFRWQGQDCVQVTPLDAGFQDYGGAIWPVSWVCLPGQQMDFVLD